jgi:hypothetical protein
MKSRYLFIAFAAWGASIAPGCECTKLSVTQAQKNAEVVFRGNITEISGGKIIFRIDRIWKGDIARTFTMPEFTESAACMGFSEGLLKVGNDLLVYAKRLHRFQGDEDYFTSICTRTGLSRDSGEDFRRLGKGKPPRTSLGRQQ